MLSPRPPLGLGVDGCAISFHVHSQPCKKRTGLRPKSREKPPQIVGKSAQQMLGCWGLLQRQLALVGGVPGSSEAEGQAGQWEEGDLVEGAWKCVSEHRAF